MLLSVLLHFQFVTRRKSASKPGNCCKMLQMTQVSRKSHLLVSPSSQINPMKLRQIERKSNRHYSWDNSTSSHYILSNVSVLLLSLSLSLSSVSCHTRELSIWIIYINNSVLHCFIWQFLSILCVHFNPKTFGKLIHVQRINRL